MSDPFSSDLSRRRFLALTGAGGAALLLGACSSGSKSKVASSLSAQPSPTAAGSASAVASQSGAASSSAGGLTYDGPSVTLAFWNGFTGGDEPFIKQVVDQFNSANPKINVKMNVYQWADFFQKLPAAVTSGSGPDVAAMHIDDIPTQAAQNVIVPIDDVAQALGLSADSFAPAVWQGGLYKGKRYGIPLDVHPLVYYYNKKVLSDAGLDPDKPPTTMDDYMAALDTLKGKGVQGHWMSPFQFTGGFTAQSLIWQFGGDMFDSQFTKATWDSDAAVQAVTWCVDLVKKGYSPKNVGQDADYVAFKNNKNAFNWNGIWQINDLAATPGMQWGAMAIPHLGPQGGAWGNSHQFVVPRQLHADKNKQDAAKFFISWLGEHSLEWAKSGKVPAEKSVRDSAEFQQLQPEATIAKDLAEVHFPPSVAGIGDALGKFYDAVNQAVLQKADVASVLKSSAAQATKIMQDNAKKYG
ncbi:MAG TPA: ABC transporter substrate-binding protein [Acidothermaceae bacterium]